MDFNLIFPGMDKKAWNKMHNDLMAEELKNQKYFGELLRFSHEGRGIGAKDEVSPTRQETPSDSIIDGFNVPTMLQPFSKKLEEVIWLSDKKSLNLSPIYPMSGEDSPAYSQQLIRSNGCQDQVDHRTHLWVQSIASCDRQEEDDFELAKATSLPGSDMTDEGIEEDASDFSEEIMAAMDEEDESIHSTHLRNESGFNVIARLLDADEIESANSSLEVKDVVEDEVVDTTDDSMEENEDETFEEFDLKEEVGVIVNTLMDDIAKRVKDEEDPVLRLEKTESLYSSLLNVAVYNSIRKEREEMDRLATQKIRKNPDSGSEFLVIFIALLPALAYIFLNLN